MNRSVRDAEVAERNQPSESNRLEQSDLIRKVALAEFEQIAVVATKRRRRQPEEKARRKDLQDPAIAIGGGMVELVDHDVIETRQVLARELVRSRQRLHRREDAVTIEFGAPVHDVAQRAFGVDRTKRSRRLAQQFLAVRDEQDPLRVAGVERREKSLTEAGCRHDQRLAQPVGAEPFKFLQCQRLYRARLDRREVHLSRHWFRESLNPTPCPVRVDPVRRERIGIRALEQLVEAGPNLVHRLPEVDVEHGPRPLHAFAQSHPGQVGRSNVGAARAVRPLEQVGLGVETPPLVTVDPRIEKAGPLSNPVEGIGLGDAEIIGRQEPDVGAP